MNFKSYSNYFCHLSVCILFGTLMVPIFAYCNNNAHIESSSKIAVDFSPKAQLTFSANPCATQLMANPFRWNALSTEILQTMRAFEAGLRAPTIEKFERLDYAEDFFAHYEREIKRIVFFLNGVALRPGMSGHFREIIRKYMSQLDPEYINYRIGDRQVKPDPTSIQFQNLSTSDRLNVLIFYYNRPRSILIEFLAASLLSKVANVDVSVRAITHKLMTKDKIRSLSIFQQMPGAEIDIVASSYHSWVEVKLHLTEIYDYRYTHDVKAQIQRQLNWAAEIKARLNIHIKVKLLIVGLPLSPETIQAFNENLQHINHLEIWHLPLDR